jgi:hypothetical protein
MNCPECGEEMDVINRTPSLQINVCDAPGCPRRDVPCATENHEYLDRILPDCSAGFQPAICRQEGGATD